MCDTKVKTVAGMLSLICQLDFNMKRYALMIIGGFHRGGKGWVFFFGFSLGFGSCNVYRVEFYLLSQKTPLLFLHLHALELKDT